MDVHFYHDSRKQAYRSIFGAAPTGCTVVLRLDATGLAQDATAVVRLWINGQGEALYAMTYDGTAFTAPVPMPQTGCLVWYYFIIKDGEETFYYGNNAGQTGGVGAVYEDAPPSYQITVYEKDATTPDWFKTRHRVPNLSGPLLSGQRHLCRLDRQTRCSHSQRLERPTGILER